MEQAKRNQKLNEMVRIGEQVDAHLDTRLQERGNITYYADLKLGNSGLGAENVYIVEIVLKERYKTGDKTENKTIYEIYDEDDKLIATVTEEGKLHLMPEYLEHFSPEYFAQLDIDNLDFEFPEELQENDIVMTKGELKEYENMQLERNKEGKINDKETGEKEKVQEEIEEEQEEQEDSEEIKKEQTAEALGVDASDIKSICSIDPREKITDTYNLIDIMPEAEGYDEILIVYSSQTDKEQGQFTIVGISQNRETKSTSCTPLTSIEPVEGTSTDKDVISVNEDGTEVTEKQVQGLFRINSRGGNDAISVSIGSYGMMNVDYVSNVLDKESRRATPVETKGPENVRTLSEKVRENAGDSIKEVEKEGRIFRARQEEGIDPQSLDGVDTDKADGGAMTLEELKQHITEKTLEQGEMSRADTREFIKSEIAKSGLELSEDEIEHTTEEIAQMVLDESRFPTR